ncbi:MAG: hypothetical protein ACTSVV_00495 [Promethearchaeota archaeon]
MGKKEKKEVKFSLDEIPVNGCIIRDDYYICKNKKGDIKVGKVIELSPGEQKTFSEISSKTE